MSPPFGYRRADDRGIPNGASNLGLLPVRQGDLDGAEAAFRRANDRGQAAGASNLGFCSSRRDPACAEAAYRRGRLR